MALKIGVPTTTAGVAYTLTDGDFFYNFAGDTVISTGNNAVVVTGSDNALVIGGHIYGSSNGLVIGDAVSDADNVVDVLAGGVVGSTGTDAIMITASHTTLNNAGTIVAADDGITVSQSSGPGTTAINNSGLISAYFWGVYNNGAEDLLLTNTGTIQSTFAFSYVGGTAFDDVINKGLMVGGVNLNDGIDIYDGRMGRIIANASGSAVLGGLGNDTMLGGKFVDTFDGGADNDKLTGGLAADLLAGGLGQDKFVFNALAERGDIISDFATVDDTILVKASAFGGLAKGALSAAAFYASASGLAHDASDRFIYETDVDKLWYDSNGNASGGRVLLADLNDVSFTRFDILVF